MGDIKALFEQIIEDGIVTRDEHDEFMDEMHADGQIDAEESEIISRFFKLIQEGKVRIVDSEREKAELLRREELQKKMQSIIGGDNSEE